MKEKLVQFGAGNIGRSFIGQVFARGGWEVVFVDIDENIVEGMNREGKYRVVVKKNEEPDEILTVSNVRAVNGKNAEAVAEEIADCGIVATSVGKGALPHIFPVIAKGIEKRRATRPESPLDIIIAENIRNGAEYFSKELSQQLPKDFPLNEYIGLVETSIGKMVPIMKKEDLEQDPLWVFAESYNNLILDKGGFKNPFPPMDAIKPVQNITAYVDRKLFIHNMGHAATAYFGYQHNPDFIYIWEALEVPEMYNRVKKAMEESKEALHREYPEDLSLKDLDRHIEDLLYRFQNRALGDTIFRVGRDLYRKLGKSDRIVGSMLLAKKHELSCETIAQAYVAGCSFRAKDEKGELFPGDKEFSEKEWPKGIEGILKDVSNLSEKDPLEEKVIEEVKKQT